MVLLIRQFQKDIAVVLVEEVMVEPEHVIRLVVMVLPNKSRKYKYNACFKNPKNHRIKL